MALSPQARQLAALFPEVVVEGKVDLGRLRALLGEDSIAQGAQVGLSWEGEAEARRRCFSPPTHRLCACPAESVDWEGSRNTLIEGENLAALKAIRESHAGSVKLIYIDPPYNTGNDLLYHDRFRGDDWQAMMLPRLHLARELLRPDGAIFVSIDDHEVHHLRILMDRVFGAENFITTIIWQKVYAPKNSARHFSEDHDYIVVYARSAERWRPELLPRSPKQDAPYKNRDEDPRGPWRPNNLSARNPYSKGTYPITCPGGRVIPGPPAGSYWRLSLERLQELDADGRIWWGKDGNNVPAPKIFLSEVKGGRVPQTLWSYEAVGHSQEGKRELLEHLSFATSAGVFDAPKPTRLIEQVIRIGTRPAEGDLVLDFFAGSGTSGEAVMKLNEADGGDRRFLLVQIPVSTGAVDYPTIADITKARLRAAGEKLRAARPNATGDLGFRLYTAEPFADGSDGEA